MNNFERFNEEKLPPRKHFFSSTKKEKIDDDDGDDDGEISDGHISIKDYLTCEKIWDKFKMKNMGDYLDHYLKNDVLLLTDVFEKFIDTCLKFYGLDPCHYFSSPGLSWDAMLKMVEIEKGLRAGISYIAKRYAKANNKCMNDYDPEKPPTFITYPDMNNLYGWAMSEYLPYDEFEWLENIDELDINSINKKSDTGYFFEVDLEYLDNLHELHNDFPLAPEKLAVSSNMLLRYCRKIADKYQIKVGDVKKLIPKLGNKI